MYMLFWVLQRIIISLILILCMHYIYIFLKTNLTTPKTKDLVNQPREQYKEIYEKININKHGSSPNNSEKNVDNSQDKTSVMKDELKSYLKDLKHSNNNSTMSTNSTLPTNITSHDINSRGDSNFSTY